METKSSTVKKQFLIDFLLINRVLPVLKTDIVPNFKWLGVTTTPKTL
jgi:hypothetical protein